ncbi:MAG: 3-deoxy-D-manno-octulosonic acid transferase, partial [Candidatus Cloacimonadota bacterium]
GGHNPLEPAFYGKAIIMGPYHKSCRDSVQKLKQNGAILISLADRLFYDIIALVEDARSRDVMGSAARQVLKDNSSALELHLESIKAWL